MKTFDFDFSDDVEPADIPPHLRQYCQYIENSQNPYCSTRDFDADWAPIGCTVRKELVAKGLCLDDDHNEVIINTRAVRKALEL